MSMLIINAGSSSIKYTLFDSVTFNRIDCALIENIVSHYAGFRQMQKQLLQHNVDIHSIEFMAHRVVHGGEVYHHPILITEEVLESLSELSVLAPLHNPHNIEGIRAAQEIAPGVPNYAVFDTTYHQTIPPYAYLYPLPSHYYQNYGIRKYGFHGSSHHFVAQKAADLLHKPLETLNLITLHIGNGVSVCAIHSGKSIDTSMGMTPLDGLMMGTRSGSIDPSIVGYLQQHAQMSIDEVEYLLNHECGLQAIAGTNDMRSIIVNATQHEKSAVLAIEMFVYRLKMQLGAYIAIIGRLDGIVFTGGIGEHSSHIRAKVCESMEHLGIVIDMEKNNVGEIRFDHITSHIPLLKIETDEEYYIANEIIKLITHASVSTPFPYS